MTEERKNEIWAMLPVSVKLECSRIYAKESKAHAASYGWGYRDALIDLFGLHNLTAQAEEKLLFKSNYKVGDKVVITGSFCGSRGKAITLVRQYDCPREANDYQKLWAGQFEDGSMCSIAEKDFTPTVEFEQAEEKPKEPKFKVGDKVRVLDKTPLVSNIGKIATIIKQGECCKGNGWILDISKSVFLESELELYTPASKDANIDASADASHEKPLNIAENVETSTNSQTNSQAAKNVDYAQYRLDLAKEIAVAMIAANWEPAGVPRDAVVDANEIVKRLKETDNENA